MIQETLQQIAGKAQEAITSAANADALEVVRVEYLGRNGALAGLSKEIKILSLRKNPQLESCSIR